MSASEPTEVAEIDKNTESEVCLSNETNNDGRRMKSLRRALEKTVDKCVGSAKYALDAKFKPISF